MKDGVARRYGLSPFDENLHHDLENPYRRAFYIASLSELPTEEGYILKVLTEHLPELMIDLTNILGTSLINIQLPKNKKIKSLIRRKNKPKRKDNEVKTMTVPDGKGGTIKVKVY